MLPVSLRKLLRHPLVQMTDAQEGRPRRTSEAVSAVNAAQSSCRVFCCPDRCPLTGRNLCRALLTECALLTLALEGQQLGTGSVGMCGHVPAAASPTGGRAVPPP